VAPVPYYLALCAYDEGPWRPIAVRVADEVVSFVMWGVDSTDGGYWIGGLISDADTAASQFLSCWNGPLWRGRNRGYLCPLRSGGAGQCRAVQQHCAACPATAAGIAVPAVVDQAKGIIMAQLRCSPDEAFTHVVTQSQRQNRNLRDLAAEIIERTQRR
jgi:hypothetical protein